MYMLFHILIPKFNLFDIWFHKFIYFLKKKIIYVSFFGLANNFSVPFV